MVGFVDGGVESRELGGSCSAPGNADPHTETKRREESPCLRNKTDTHMPPAFGSEPNISANSLDKSKLHS